MKSYWPRQNKKIQEGVYVFFPNPRSSLGIYRFSCHIFRALVLTTCGSRKVRRLFTYSWYCTRTAFRPQRLFSWQFNSLFKNIESHQNKSQYKVPYLQKCVNFVFLFTIYITFFHQRKIWLKAMTRANVFQAINKFVFVCGWFLKSELVTRKADNSQPTWILRTSFWFEKFLL